jgi:hypothetical protein
MMAAGILFRKTSTDRQPDQISEGRNPSGAEENLSAETIPQSSAPEVRAKDFISSEVNTTAS